MKYIMKRISLLLAPILLFIVGWMLLGPPCEAQAQELATIEVEARLSSMPARAIATARDHHFIVDSPPPLGGSNEEVNPIEGLLSALATCGVLVSEKVAREEDIPLSAATAAAEGDLDPRGVRGEPVNPRIQVFRVRLVLTGPSEDQAEALVEAVRTRCPIYTTLERSAPIEMELELSSE